MDVMSRTTLNPNAPLFVPMAYQTVEDYSDEWWALIQSAPWFRDYWLRECFQDPQNTPPFSEIDDPFLPDIDALFDGYISNQEEEEEEEGEGEKEGYAKDLVSFGSLKWRKPRSETARIIEKVPKIVNLKVNPRPIQQPR